jgi:hypothetical protein
MTVPQIDSTRMLQAKFTPAALYYLRSRWVLMAVAVLALVAIVASTWSWLVAAGLATILVSALPCLVMCGLGLCMHRFLGFGSTQTSGSAAAEPPEGAARAATDNSATYAATCCGGATLVPAANLSAKGAAGSNENSET